MTWQFWKTSFLTPVDIESCVWREYRDTGERVGVQVGVAGRSLPGVQLHISIFSKQQTTTTPDQTTGRVLLAHVSSSIRYDSVLAAFI